mgnify:CR=1 FL=1
MLSSTITSISGSSKVFTIGLVTYSNQSKIKVLKVSKNNSHSLSLDLYDQWKAMEANAQWRFTPPTHVLAAFYQTLKEHHIEGGIQGRYDRYMQNCKILCKGMKEIGFKQLLPEHLQAPIIITFMQPNDPSFNFEQFYDVLSKNAPKEIHDLEAIIGTSSA